MNYLKIKGGLKFGYRSFRLGIIAVLNGNFQSAYHISHLITGYKQRERNT